jgi:hypothetical protein
LWEIFVVPISTDLVKVTGVRQLWEQTKKGTTSMATYTDQFTVAIECQTKEEADWCLARLKESYVQACEIFVEDNIVYVFSDWQEIVCFDDLVGVVIQYQKQFKVSAPWVGSYCRLCSNPDSEGDRSSSGAVVVYRGKPHWFNATELAKKKAREVVRSSRRK